MRLADQLWDLIGVIDRDKVQFICIGSMLISGDAVAPIIGTLLSCKGYDVIGTESNTLNGSNIEERQIELDSSKIHIAIDCSVLNVNSVRSLYDSFAVLGGIKPGSGIGKRLGSYGDYSIHVPMTVTSNTSLFTLFSLREVPMSVVREVADTVACEIELFLTWCDEAIDGLEYDGYLV